MGAKTECPNGEKYIGRLTGEYKLGARGHQKMHKTKRKH